MPSDPSSELVRKLRDAHCEIVRANLEDAWRAWKDPHESGVVSVVADIAKTVRKALESLDALVQIARERPEDPRRFGTSLGS